MMMSKQFKRFLCVALSAAIQIGTAGAGEAVEPPAQTGPATRNSEHREHISCEAMIGTTAADRLRKLCIGVSPATHPPCGTRNSCALIEDEIARSCAIIGDRDAAKTPACPSEPSSAAAAVDVLRRFYEALDAHDYATAYAMLKPDGGKGQTFDAFRQGYAATRSTRVTPGKPGEIEGAAGSSYVTIPVIVEAILDDGKQQRFRGSYVLRIVGGHTTPPTDDERWHIFSAHLEQQRWGSSP